MNKLFLSFCFVFSFGLLPLQNQAAESARIANPVVAGYFADPSVLLHEGKAYMFATKDPWGGDDLACFSSEDLFHWTPHTLNWPTYDSCVSENKSGAKVWAPEVIQGPDNRFYLYVSVGSEIYCGVASHPLGPWKNVRSDQGPIIATQKSINVHTIDASPFIDDDGRIYLYWGSGWDWKDGRCLAVELEKDMHTFKGEIKDITPLHYFEAPHMIKREGGYYLMYSEGKTVDKTYKVHYAVSSHPMGPFQKVGKNSPILETDEGRQVWGPGHHCIFKLNGQDYIAYHRHKRPYHPDPFLRQICFDKMEFDEEGFIMKVVPTDAGIWIAKDIDEVDEN